jgi:hypothetical protein
MGVGLRHCGHAFPILVVSFVRQAGQSSAVLAGAEVGKLRCSASGFIALKGSLVARSQGKHTRIVAINERE